MAKILIIEDDRSVSFVLKAVLNGKGHVVDVAGDGVGGLAYLSKNCHEIAIIDWSLPDTTGLAVCQSYRENGGLCPIIFLTGRASLARKVEALDSGADDFMCKPFELQELLARINAILRRPAKLIEDIISINEITLNPTSCGVTINGNRVKLAIGEYTLLKVFMRNPGKMFSLNELLEQLYPEETPGNAHALRQKIMRLRKLINQYSTSDYIYNLKGKGYRFAVQKD